MGEKAYLVLENGVVMAGKRFGAHKDVQGEIRATTEMVGYLESLTDKNNYGKVLLHTFPLIGNYGVIPEDFESEQVTVAACIVKHWCDTPSNFRSQGDIDSLLCEQDVVGLYGIDTRELMRILRKEGSMNVAIVSDPSSVDQDGLKALKEADCLGQVSTKEVAVHAPEGDVEKHFAMLDLGANASVIRSFPNFGCQLTVFPYNTSAERIIAAGVDGVVVSDGPGSPIDHTDMIATLTALRAHRIPILGLGLGHQLLALAFGGKVQKMTFGHGGGNIPVRDVESGEVYITRQNHNYVVKDNSLDSDVASDLFVNIHDHSNEGIAYRDYPAFSVQFQPSGKLQDRLYQRFVVLSEEVKHATR